MSKLTHSKRTVMTGLAMTGTVISTVQTVVLIVIILTI